MPITNAAPIKVEQQPKYIARDGYVAHIAALYRLVLAGAMPEHRFGQIVRRAKLSELEWADVARLAKGNCNE